VEGMMRYIQVLSFILNHQIVRNDPAVLDSSVLGNYLQIFFKYSLSYRTEKSFSFFYHHLISLSSNSFIQENILKIEDFYQLFSFLLENYTSNYFKNLLQTFPEGILPSIILKAIHKSLNPFQVIPNVKDFLIQTQNTAEFYDCFCDLLGSKFQLNFDIISILISIFRELLPRTSQRDILKAIKFGSYLFESLLHHNNNSQQWENNMSFLINNVPLMHSLFLQTRVNQSEMITPKGLPNCGNTCYLNSTIQQLFWISDFREGILSYSSNNMVFQSLELVFQKLSDFQSPAS
jgi:hypothetical protein